MGLYNFYEKRIFPLILDPAMRSNHPYRKPTLSRARGRVLEIGFGTGLNLDQYPPGVESLTAIDPMDAVKERVQQRISAVPFPVERHALAADGVLPFADASFDCVTVTWTLCTIPDPVAALVEMRRVAVPGSELLFIEHGQSDDPKVARFQDRLNPFWKVIGCGCNLNRQIDQLIEKGGFRIDSLERFEIDGPRFAAHQYRGVATA